MSVTLFNTMSRTVVPLQPMTEPIVKLYTCGPTVYDYPHIGNWAAYIRWDLLVRMLKESGYDITWVMNITDVGHLISDADEGEDKLEKGARREGKTAWDVAAFYTTSFLSGMKALNITTPTHIVKATDTIPEQIAFVKKLEAKGYTYIIDDGVYFDTSKSADYGKLARLNIEGLEAGARVEFNQQKRHITDFAVWKLTPKGEKRDMEWDSPWGKGFPGWHLECSVMAMKYLGETLDIHAGGFDHLSIHHPNEIAQSEAVTGKPFAHIWLHSNFLTVQNVKLSKSLGNSFTLQDIEAKGFTPFDLRMLFLQSHYRSQADFTWENLAAAHQRLQSLRAMADLRWQTIETNFHSDTASILTAGQGAMLKALQEDLTIPRALAELGVVERQLTESLIDTKYKKDFIAFLSFLDRTLGLEFLTSEDISDTLKALIEKREVARKKKDFLASDELRNELLAQGIALRDTASGPIWSRL